MYCKSSSLPKYYTQYGSSYDPKMHIYDLDSKDFIRSITLENDMIHMKMCSNENINIPLKIFEKDLVFVPTYNPYTFGFVDKEIGDAFNENILREYHIYYSSFEVPDIQKFTIYIGWDNMKQITISNDEEKIKNSPNKKKIDVCYVKYVDIIKEIRNSPNKKKIDVYNDKHIDFNAKNHFGKEYFMDNPLVTLKK